MTNRTVTIDGTKCTGCGDCLPACPEEAIHMQAGIAVIDGTHCAACLACVAVCEAQAIIVAETVAVAPRPASTIQTAGARTRTIGTALATLGGAALAFVADRVGSAILDRLAQDRTPDTATPPADSVQGTTTSSRPAGGGGGGGGGAGGRRRRRRGR